MLPGFRFLCAAIVLCLSLVVFGLGATALLRSAREDVASLPVPRAAPQTVFEPRSQPEPPATLAMLRVEVADPLPAAAAEPPIALPPQALALASPETEKQASVSLPPAVQLPAAELPAAAPAPSAPAVEAVAAEMVATATPAAPVVAPAEEVIAEAPAIAMAVATAEPDRPASTLTETDTQIAVMNIATLGGPAVDIEPVPLPKAKPARREKTVEAAPKKKKKARVEEKPAKRRRLAARAEAPAPATAPTPPETFGWQVPQR